MDNTIRYFYEQAILLGFTDLQLFIEYLLFEQEVISLDDDMSTLDFYMKPNNKPRMVKLLKEYKEEKAKNGIS